MLYLKGISFYKLYILNNLNSQYPVMYSSDDSEFEYDANEQENDLYTHLYFGNGSQSEPKCYCENDGKVIGVGLSQDKGESGVKNKKINSGAVDPGLLSHLSASSAKCDNLGKKFVSSPQKSVIDKNRASVNDLVQGVRRKRNESVCSFDSTISGKEPLDNLYCNTFLDDIINLSAISEARLENDLSNSDTNSESRCNMFLKKKKHKGKSFSSLDKEPILSPGSPKNILVEVLSSSSDESIKILHVEKKRITKSDSHNACMKEKKTELKKSPHIIISSGNNTCSDDVGNHNLSVPLLFNMHSSQASLTKNLTPKSKSKHRQHTRSQVIFTKERPVSKKYPSCPKWTQDMASLYDSDYSDEFSVEEIHKRQSDSAKKWKICPEDRVALPVWKKPRRRYFEVRCSRCREFGHTIKKCTKVPHCLFCASTTHIFIKHCPKNCCLKCGREPHRYCSLTQHQTCHLCSSFGHHSSLCPDLWRRYHATTAGCVPVVPDSGKQFTKRRIRYCYNCAKKGHYGHECRNHIATKYARVSTEVVSYSIPYLTNKLECSATEPAVHRTSSKTGTSPAVHCSPRKKKAKKLLTLSGSQLRVVVGKAWKKQTQKIMEKTNTKITFSIGKSMLTIVGFKENLEDASNCVTKILTQKSLNNDLGTLKSVTTIVKSPRTTVTQKNQQKKKKPSEQPSQLDRLDDVATLHNLEAEKDELQPPAPSENLPIKKAEKRLSPKLRKVKKTHLLARMESLPHKSNASLITFPDALSKETSVLHRFPLSLPLNKRQAVEAILYVLKPIKTSLGIEGKQRLLKLYENVLHYFRSYDFNTFHNKSYKRSKGFRNYFSLLSTLIPRTSKVIVAFVKRLRQIKGLLEISKDEHLDPLLFMEASSFYAAVTNPPRRILFKMVALAGKQWKKLE